MDQPNKNTFSPKLFKLFFSNSHDAQYISSLETGQFLIGNPSFCALTGYTQQEIMEGALHARDLIPPEEKEGYSKRIRERTPYKPERYSMPIQCKNGEIKHIEFFTQVVEYQGEWIVIGSCRDISERTKLERKLQEENARHKKLTFDTARANIRIYQLTEKIKNVPRIMGELLKFENVREVIDKAVDLLTDPTGMNYREVRLFLVEDDKLVLRSGAGVGTLSMPLQSDDILARIARGQEAQLPDDAESYAVPIRTRQHTLGVMQVFFNKEEKVLFDEINMIRSSQRDVISTLGSSLGLLIANLRLYERVKEHSITDALTGMYNRRYFDQKVQDEVTRAIRYSRDLSLMHMDLDHFKEVNDVYGHPQGDKVLQEYANILRKFTRDSDIVCRLGGDEFVVLLPETNIEAAHRVAEKLRREVKAYKYTLVDSKAAPFPFDLSVSIGVAATNAMIDTPEKLIKVSDEALYESKRLGRDRITLYPFQPAGR